MGNRLLHLFSLLCLMALPLSSRAEINAAQKKVPLADLEKKISEKIDAVEEFAKIRAWAESKGIKVYLFGGTASSFAHYAKLDLAREKGDSRLAPERFGYRIDQIFLPNQDLDIVIDGSAAQAKELQEFVGKEMPYFMGRKERWEVTLLREDLGDKPAKLGNPNFLNQHTDSLSVGAIELNSPSPGESRVKDVLHWDAKQAPFLRDVAEGKIRYLFNPLHDQTKFFLEGRNPPFLSAVRFLTKASQFGLKVDEVDEKKIVEVVKAFQPSNSSYVNGWLDKNLPKLVKNSADLEETYRSLDRSGMRQALLKGKGIAPGELQTLLARTPLPSIPLGEGTGQTAEQLAIKWNLPKIEISHDTRSMDDWYSITRALDGKVNALESSTGHNGRGMYFAVGNKGAYNGGFTVHAELLPQAREGADFIISDLADGTHNNIVVLNKNAIKLRATNPTEIDPLLYFRYKLDPKLAQKMRDEGQGVWAETQLNSLRKSKISNETHAQIENLLLQYLKNTGLEKYESAAAFTEAMGTWLDLPGSLERANPLLRELLNTGPSRAFELLGGTEKAAIALERANPKFYSLLAADIARHTKNGANKPFGYSAATGMYSVHNDDRYRIANFLALPKGIQESGPLITALAEERWPAGIFDLFIKDPRIATALEQNKEEIANAWIGALTKSADAGTKLKGVRHYPGKYELETWVNWPEALNHEEVPRMLIEKGYPDVVKKVFGENPLFAPMLEKLQPHLKSAATAQKCDVGFSRLGRTLAFVVPTSGAGYLYRENYLLPLEDGKIAGAAMAKTCQKALVSLTDPTVRRVIIEKREKIFFGSINARNLEISSSEGCGPLLEHLKKFSDGTSAWVANFLLSKVSSPNSLKAWESSMSEAQIPFFKAERYLQTKLSVELPSRQESAKLAAEHIKSFPAHVPDGWREFPIKILKEDPANLAGNILHILNSPSPQFAPKYLCSWLLEFGLDSLPPAESLDVFSRATYCHETYTDLPFREKMYSIYLTKAQTPQQVREFARLIGKRQAQ